MKFLVYNACVFLYIITIIFTQYSSINTNEVHTITR